MTEYRTVSIGNSLYRFFDEYWLALPHINDRAMHRVCSLMRKLNVHTAIIEKLYSNNKEIKTEKKALDKYFGIKLKSKIFRITFSDQIISNDADLEEDGIEYSFLGKIIIINIWIPPNLDIDKVGTTGPKGYWHSYIYHATATVPFSGRDGGKRYYLLNNYIHTVSLITGQFKTKSNKYFNYSFYGSNFYQKSRYTSVCSQAALCMTINNSELIKDEIFIPESVNKIAGIDHVNKKFGAKKDEHKAGFKYEDIQKVLEHLGFKVTIMDFFKNPNIDYVEFLYPYMESQCPTMLVFVAGPELHIVPILGHTLNTDMWRPEAELAYNSEWFSSQILQDVIPFQKRSSSAWIDHLIIHDDNFGMYHCLPVDSLRRTTLPKFDISFRAIYGIAIIPREIGISAEQCDYLSSLVLRNFIVGLKKDGYSLSYWLDKIEKSIFRLWHSPFVTRTLLANKEDYKIYLETVKDFEGNQFTKVEQNKILEDLPKTFWLTEISLPDLYTANKSKVADFYCKCDAPKQNTPLFENIIQIRLAEWFIKFGDHTKVPVIEKLSSDNHFPLFCYKEICEPAEW